jgi:hypothetical protein
MVIKFIVSIILITTLTSCALFQEGPRVVEVPIFVDRELTEQLQSRFEIDQRPTFTQEGDLVCLDDENRDIMTLMIQDMMFRVRLWEAEMGIQK